MENEFEEDMTDEELEELFKQLAEGIEDYKTPLQLLGEDLQLREVITEELALVLGLSENRIRQLWKEGVIEEPRKEGKKHYFDLLSSVEFYLRYLRSR